jgi:hypothetical protein
MPDPTAPQDPPHFSLAAIQAAVKAGDYFFGKPAMQRLAAGKWTVEDAEAWIAALLPQHFHQAGITTDPANPGQKFDSYKLRVGTDRVMWMKLELYSTGQVEIISLHRTDKGKKAR